MFRVIYLCFTFYVFYENVKKSHFFPYHFRKNILRFCFFIYVYVQFHILRFFLHFFILRFFTLFYVYVFLRFLLFFMFLFTKQNVNIKSIYVFYVYDFFYENVKNKCKKCIYVNHACAWFSGEGHRS